MNVKKYDLNNCARCGGNHKIIKFEKLERPFREYTHWAPCPVNGQPILMKHENTGYDHCLIWSIEHHMWWKPCRRGYTSNISEAGIYEKDEVRSILKQANIVGINEIAIQLTDIYFGTEKI